MSIYYFRVLGKVRGKQRARTRLGKEGKIHFYTPLVTRDYEKLIKESYISANSDVDIISSYFKIKILIIQKIPDYYPKKRKALCKSGLELPGKCPDIDNIIKIVLDGLNGAAYTDDKNCIGIEADKIYGKEDCLYIVIEEIEKVLPKLLKKITLFSRLFKKDTK